MDRARQVGDLEYRLLGTRRFRSVRAEKYPEDTRNATAIDIIDRIIATIPEIPASLQTRYNQAWPDGDAEAMDFFDDVMEEASSSLGFGLDPASASEFVLGFLVLLSPTDGASGTADAA